MVNSRRKGKEGVEKWRDVIGFEGLYEVSDCGRVRSLARFTTKGRLLKLYTNNGTIPEYTGKFKKGEVRSLWR